MCYKPSMVLFVVSSDRNARCRRSLPQGGLGDVHVTSANLENVRGGYLTLAAMVELDSRSREEVYNVF